MKHKSTIYMGAGVGIFTITVLLLPLLHDNSNSTIEISKVDAVAFYSYYGTIFGGLVGGLVGGMFTYLGVKKSLDNQEDRDKQISDTYKDILTIQLKSSYRTVSEINNMEQNISNLFTPLPKLIIDNNWNEHLMQIKNLNRDEIETVGKWFNLLQKLEADASDSGNIAILKAQNTIKTIDLDAIKMIIDKLESDTAC